MRKEPIERDAFMLKGPLSRKGYDWWWHNFTACHHSTGQQRRFFIEYYVCNPALGGSKPVFGQLPENKEKHIFPSYAMIKAGAWGCEPKQIHRYFPITDFSCPYDKLNVVMGDCSLSETQMRGSCSVTPEQAKAHPEYMCDSGTIQWDLTIDKQIAYSVGYGASKLFRTLNLFEMYWHAQGIKTIYSGTIELDGERYDVIPEKSFGYADKNWGSDFTSPWLWISSCNLTSIRTGKRLQNSALEIGGGRPKILGYALDRRLLTGMVYEGKLYEYNFSKFWTGSQVTFSFGEEAKENLWTVSAKNRHSSLEVSLRCPANEMLFVNYEAPNGEKRHNRLWNGGSGYGEIKLYENRNHQSELIDHIAIRDAGCEYGEYTP